MAIKFSQFNLRTDHTSGMYLVGYDGNQNIHITVDNLFDDFINGTENTIAMFGTDGLVLADSILSQDAGATLLTVAGQLNVDAAATFDTSITVTGDSTLNGNVTLGDVTTDVITQTGTLYLNGPVKDTTDTFGTVDQVLLSDAIGELTFTDLSDLHVGGAEVVEVPVKNVQGSALVKGDPVYISGSVGASGTLEVQLADASNTLKMPAVGLLKQDLANNAEGFAVVTGKLRNLITDPIDGIIPEENYVIYVKPSGTSGAALTTTKPVYGNFIQNIGKVGRVSTAADGNLVVSSILRTNDIPNLTPGRLWVGSTGNTIESQTLFVDEANERLGIGTTSPDTDLHVLTGALSGQIKLTSQANTQFQFYGNGNQDINYGQPPNFPLPGGDAIGQIRYSHGSHYMAFKVNNAEMVRFTSNNYVGIGTTSPAGKLEINGGTGVATSGGTLIVRQDGDTSNDGIALTSSNSISHRMFKNAGGTFLMGPSTNSDAFALDLNGNVGIGTASPSTKLEISTSMSSSPSSNIFLNVDGTNTTGGGGSIIFGTSATAGTASDYNAKITGTRVAGGAGGDSELGFWTTLVSDSINPQQRMTITKEGNVGIGTTSPGTKLEILSGSGKQLRLSTGSTTYWELGRSTSTGHFEITEDSGDTYFLIDKDNGQIQFNEYGAGTFTGTVAKNLAVDSSGNVIETDGNIIDGSGTANYVPKWSDANTLTDSIMSESGSKILVDGAFEVDGGTGDTNLYLDGSTTSGTRNIYATVNGSTAPPMGRLRWSENNQTVELQGSRTSSPYGTSAITMPYGASTNDFTINLNNTTRLTIDYSNGNVGIGTTLPVNKLDVAGNVGIDESIIHNGDTDTKIGFVANDNFAITTAGTERVRVTSGGSVGIGTNNPVAKLQVSGGVQVADDSATATADRVGTLRYRSDANNSYVDMCMQTGTSTYAWINIVQNNW